MAIHLDKLHDSWFSPSTRGQMSSPRKSGLGSCAFLKSSWLMNLVNTLVLAPLTFFSSHSFLTVGQVSRFSHQRSDWSREFQADCCVRAFFWCAWAASVRFCASAQERGSGATPYALAGRRVEVSRASSTLGARLQRALRASVHIGLRQLVHACSPADRNEAKHKRFRLRVNADLFG